MKRKILTILAALAILFCLVSTQGCYDENYGGYGYGGYPSYGYGYGHPYYGHYGWEHGSDRDGWHSGWGHEGHEWHGGGGFAHSGGHGGGHRG
jgi:hypothetical protein